jgi:hypothetical protein
MPGRLQQHSIEEEKDERVQEMGHRSESALRWRRAAWLRAARPKIDYQPFPIQGRRSPYSRNGARRTT